MWQRGGGTSVAVHVASPLPWAADSDSIRRIVQEELEAVAVPVRTFEQVTPNVKLNAQLDMSPLALSLEISEKFGGRARKIVDSTSNEKFEVMDKLGALFDIHNAHAVCLLANERTHER